MGEEKSGKSSIVNCLLNNEFSENVEWLINPVNIPSLRCNTSNDAHLILIDTPSVSVELM